MPSNENPGLTMYLFSFICSLLVFPVLSGERTHQIPVEGLAKKDDTYRKIWLDLLRFVNPEQTAIFPPVYCRVCLRNL